MVFVNITDDAPGAVLPGTLRKMCAEDFLPPLEVSEMQDNPGAFIITADSLAAHVKANTNDELLRHGSTLDALLAQALDELTRLDENTHTELSNDGVAKIFMELGGLGPMVKNARALELG